MTKLTIRKPHPIARSKEQEESDRLAEERWWRENRTKQRFLIKPRYECSYAISDKSQCHLKSTFAGSVILRLKHMCEEIDQGLHRYINEPKDTMPGFTVARVKEDFGRTGLRNENFLETEVLILDIDEVPSTVQNIGLWLPSVLPSNVFAIWYSTPRWRDTSKRIRVVIPLERPISMAEKQSLPHRLVIPGVDPASYSPSKFSLLPCWCKDTVDFQWGMVGKRRLSPDGDLPPWVPQVKKDFRSVPRLKRAKEAAEQLTALVDRINNAPDGNSQPVIKQGLGKLFRRYDVDYSDCEFFSNYISREDRCKDFLGIAKWLHNKYRTNNNGI
jgi:hypothetical protein